MYWIQCCGIFIRQKYSIDKWVFERMTTTERSYEIGVFDRLTVRVPTLGGNYET